MINMPEDIKRDVMYEVKSNEDLALIAIDFQIKNWEAVYNHPKNEKLRKERPDPHVLYKGDKVWIPDIKPKVFGVETKKKHTFVLYPPKMPLNIALGDGEGGGHGEIKYEIWINGNIYDPTGNKEELRTDENGYLSQIVPFSREVEIRVFWEDEGDTEDDYEKIIIKRGGMDPIDTIEGVQGRLENLGYPIGDDEFGTEGTGTADAVRNFQIDHGLVPTGEIDELTRKRLEKAAETKE